MSGPSITNWNRLEPRPRTDSIARALAAQVRDPLWILTRQWQFGEFQGQDSASPAWVEFKARFSDIDGWAASGEASVDYQRQEAPLESVTENEPFAPDDATAVELGQRFESLLARGFASAPVALSTTLVELVQQFRTSYQFEARRIDPRDHPAQSFRRVCSGRAMDGCALYEATRHTDTPSMPSVADPAVVEVIRDTIQRWRAWVNEVLGDLASSDLAQSDPSTWQPNRLEYGIDVSATTASGDRATLSAHPGRDGAFDWYAFDEQSVTARSETATAIADGTVRELTRRILPAPVKFRGMPHARWWQFQDRIANVGEIQPEIRELAKVVLMDFMFVHGNDWFVVPFTQDVGTLCRIDRLIVHDVFGGRTLIDRADRQEPGIDDQTRRWAMFATTAPNMPGGLADYFILPPSADSATLSGETLETVNFIRDEMANMVWAIETTTENGIGMPWPGRERTRANDEPPTTSVASAADLRYRIQNRVPEHWIPFVPVKIDDAGQVALERTALLRPPVDENSASEPILPVGRILRPDDPYRVREEEVSRAGVRVSRIVRHTRWMNGSTHLWIARRKQAGRGEGSSGLRFDVVDPVNRGTP